MILLIYILQRSATIKELRDRESDEIDDALLCLFVFMSDQHEMTRICQVPHRVDL